MTLFPRVLVVVWFASACVDTGARVRELELRVRGRDLAAFAGRNDWSVELTRARIAFGPVTFCPGRSAGEFCETARAEWLDSAVVDALDDRSRRAGDVIGTTGAVSSWMYDYGFVSLLTETRPYATQAARKLDDQSVDVEGCVVKAEQRVCFELRTIIAQTTGTEQGVPVVRVNGTGDSYDFGSIDVVEFTFDPAQWLAQVDFDEVASAAECENECNRVVLAADSQAVRAVQTALVASARPGVTFEVAE
jgi:hypothetical protein